MPKAKTSYLTVSSLSTLIVGVLLGVMSQNIPRLLALTDNAIPPIEGQFPYSPCHIQETSLPAQPISSFIIHRPGYSLAYDARNRNPAWVYEHLTTEKIHGDADRIKSDFKEDPRIPEHLQAKLTDYKYSGFDRGHMAPAGNHKLNPERMDDTFYLTNMCPQCPQFNRGYWAMFEKHVRDLTRDYENIYVITGPLYLPQTDANGQRYVKYQVIGPNNVAVPTHFFKFITMEDCRGKRQVEGFIMPNQNVELNTPLNKFKTTIKRIEKSAGLILSS